MSSRIKLHMILKINKFCETLLVLCFDTRRALLIDIHEEFP